MKRKLLFGLFTVFAFLSFPRISHAQVVINEFSSSTGSDWVELYSPENVDISGWILDDSGTESNLKEFGSGTSIGPLTNSYIVVEVGDRLNNSGDTIELFKKDKVKVDSIVYGGSGNVCLPSVTGSVARFPNGGNIIDRLWTATKGVTNDSGEMDPCPTPTPTQSITPSNTPTNTPTQTATVTPTVKPSVTPTKILTNTPTYTPTDSPAESGEELVLGSSDSFTETPDPTDSFEVESDGESTSFILPIIFIVLGIGFISSAVFLIVKSRKMEYNENSDEGKNNKDS